MNALTGNKAVLLLFRSIEMNALTGNAQNHAARSIVYHCQETNVINLRNAGRHSMWVTSCKRSAARGVGMRFLYRNYVVIQLHSELRKRCIYSVPELRLRLARDYSYLMPSGV
jgi:hypothetical protein